MTTPDRTITLVRIYSEEPDRERLARALLLVLDLPATTGKAAEDQSAASVEGR